ncbi:MAG: CcoQ/FixQ family Cbb3-type cytochrome c oxidase assembly chaperone [Flavipsychrobacter sp.]|nr:CcoQ/FixQ family Cbb3-type cytochrome c oxidase assembly chaperone [Flavipsychrobacter sp.]
MKFINYLQSITGVGIFPLVSLVIFFLFFSALSLWAFRADKGYIRTMKQIPFGEQE